MPGKQNVRCTCSPDGHSKLQSRKTKEGLKAWELYWWYYSVLDKRKAKLAEMPEYSCLTKAVLLYFSGTFQIAK